MWLLTGREMRGRIILIFGIFFLLSCSEEPVPEGLYDYQVERLLSGGDIKIWIESKRIEQCSDTVLLHVSLVEGSIDSLNLSRIIFNSSCVRDTLPLGNAKPSSFSSGPVFTDSLVFSNGDFWLVDRVTSQELQILRNGTTQRFVEYEE